MDSLKQERRLARAELDDYENKALLKFMRRGKKLFHLPDDIAYAEADSAEGENHATLKRRLKTIDGKQTLITGIKYQKLQKFAAGAVVLDPTIETSLDAVEDVWLENSGNKNYYSMLLVAKDRNYAKKRSIIKFDISSIPGMATIQSASLNMYYFSRGGSSSQYPWIDRPIRTHRLLKDWQEAYATSIKRTSAQNWSGTLAEGERLLKPKHAKRRLLRVC